MAGKKNIHYVSIDKLTREKVRETAHYICETLCGLAAGRKEVRPYGVLAEAAKVCRHYGVIEIHGDGPGAMMSLVDKKYWNRPKWDGVVEECLDPAFVDSLKIGDGCWEYTGYINEKGYGIYAGKPTASGKAFGGLAHRVAYEIFVPGGIPKGLVIDHLCENKACCRPSHLEAVTNSENARRRCNRNVDRIDKTQRDWIISIIKGGSETRIDEILRKAAAPAVRGARLIREMIRDGVVAKRDGVYVVSDGSGGFPAQPIAVAAAIELALADGPIRDGDRVLRAAGVTRAKGRAELLGMIGSGRVLRSIDGVFSLPLTQP